MESFLKSDIFFLITSASVILIVVMLLVILGYILRIAKNIKDMTDLAKDGTESFFKHVSDFGENIRKEGAKAAKSVTSLVSAKVAPKKRTKKKE